ncbi:WhiB family transcriptional regulator [Mycobacteroides abscessus subsp. abscessus]|nr:WhiB family transcriptional regulator [Mycobacteroides abscessus subsp. abscessus]
MRNIHPGPRIIDGGADMWSINHEPWTEQALCPETDPELFYPTPGSPGRTMAKAAKAICARCPVAAECLEYAFRANEEYGIFGGVTAHERMVMKRGRAS